jgi:hypothetical protein
MLRHCSVLLARPPHAIDKHVIRRPSVVASIAPCAERGVRSTASAASLTTAPNTDRHPDFKRAPPRSCLPWFHRRFDSRFGHRRRFHNGTLPPVMPRFSGSGAPSDQRIQTCTAPNVFCIETGRVPTKMHVGWAPKTKARSIGGMAKPQAQQMAKQDTLAHAAFHWSHSILHGARIALSMSSEG